MTAPPLGPVLETALYVADLKRAAAFFTQVLGLPTLFENERLQAFDAGPGSVLLLFARGGSGADTPTPGGVIPGHDGAGRSHMAFAIAARDVDAWRDHLMREGVAIRSEVRWPRGGHSLYFDDPDSHVLELATPGLWANY
ncbi:MAG: glyoxalase [Sphingomonas bacterium]|uniref:VOC family protein n=1 Tax=Sphingomonas bacterium TaxID=1895847 RepID=UPI00260C5CAA|nr:VOC family protein [Sphingomonas bacterium]MDB5696508.1 glyoxalase [Sphingomonas bacterium]